MVKRKETRFDSHQVIGALMIFGVLVALIGFALQRFDVVIMAIAAAGLVAAMVGRPGGRADGAGDGRYEEGDGSCDGGGD